MISFDSDINHENEVKNFEYNYFMCSLYKMKNGTIFIKFPNHFGNFENLPKSIYFSLVDGNLFLTFEPIYISNYETHKRQIQRAGYNGCQVRVPFPHNFKSRFRPQDYIRADLHKIDNGIYNLEPKIERNETIPEEYNNIDKPRSIRWF